MMKTAAKFMLTAAALLLGGLQAQAQTAVKFALDWKFEGPAAPYFTALEKGYYKAEGLDVTIDTGPGSVQGIARVAAGTYPLGFFDITSLVRFRDQNPDQKVVAVMMVYDRPPFSIVSLKKAGIKFFKTPDAILREQLVAYDKVVAKKAAENPLFKKVIDSQRAFAERAGAWQNDYTVDMKMAWNHYFRPAAAPKKS